MRLVLAFLATAVPWSCRGEHSIVIDRPCIDVGAVEDLDPPGRGSVLVTHGLDNPTLCGVARLEDTDVGADAVDDLSSLGDTRLAYTIRGAVDDFEAFFTTDDFPFEDPLFVPLRESFPVGGQWAFFAKGLRLDPLRAGVRLQQVVFYVGNGLAGWTQELDFLATLDGRVSLVDVRVFRLVSEDTGLGPDVNEAFVRAWFGEQPTRLVDRAFPGGGVWESDLREPDNITQRVDSVVAQCDLSGPAGRIQYRLVHYEDILVADALVNDFDVTGGLCGGRRGNTATLQGLGFGEPGAPIDVYIAESWGSVGGSDCEGDIGMLGSIGITDAPLLNTVFAFDRLVLAKSTSVSGADYVLVHELVHSTGIVTHCELADYGCASDDLMHDLVTDGGGTLSEDECNALEAP